MSHKAVYLKKPTQSLLLITHQTGKLPILEKIPIEINFGEGTTIETPAIPNV